MSNRAAFFTTGELEVTCRLPGSDRKLTLASVEFDRFVVGPGMAADDVHPLDFLAAVDLLTQQLEDRIVTSGDGERLSGADQLLFDMKAQRPSS